MKLITTALLLALTTVALTQTATPPPQFIDPANLRGERVRPRDGRELPIDGGDPANTALALQQLLRKLNTRASILNIVAHPDDEDGGMLTFYSRGLGARVADLSLTRGEGGQNAMTGDFEDALGLLRTQELLANDRYTGVDQMFGTEADFGFSKTKSEAFAKWTHDRVLYDAVRAVRLYRPLVITSTWIGGVTDGHSQHQVSGQIAQEAFAKAGDPTVFPDMIAEGILPWQPLRVYARVPTQSISEKGLFDYATGQYVAPTFTNYVTGEVTHTPPTTDILVHEGQPDPLLTPAAANPSDLDSRTTNHQSLTTPLTYVQFARIGLGLQRSQIPAGFRLPPAGTYDVPYHLYGSCPTTDFRTCHPERSEGPATSSKAARKQIPDANFFTGIDTSIEGTATLAPSATGNIAAIIKTNLVGIQHSIDEAKLTFQPAHPELAAKLLATALKQTDTALQTIDEFKNLASLEQANLLHELLIKRNQINDALVLALGIRLSVSTAASSIPVATDAEAIARLTQDSTPHVLYRFIESRNSLGAGIEEGSRMPSTEPHLALGHPVTSSCGLSSDLNSTITQPYFMRSSTERPVYQLTKPELRNAPSAPPALTCYAAVQYDTASLIIGAVAEYGNQPVSIVPAGPATYRSIGYGDLPRTNYYPPAPKHVDLTNINLPTRRRIAYLPGTGDAVPEALTSIGLPVTTLTVADLTPTKLAAFDTVILGVRTYAAHPDLHGAPTQALLDYARGGGNVMLQYQTAEFTASDAPYPLTLGRDAEKVVDETAPVHLLLPAQPGTAPGGVAKDKPSATPTMEYALLNTPNVITSADFNGWVAERGHGFLRTWDPHYAALTETHDPGSKEEGILPQEPQRGGLITTPLGRGRWTYCAFALYRQLPEALPGAYRLFLNLINP